MRWVLMQSKTGKSGGLVRKQKHAALYVRFPCYMCPSHGTYFISCLSFPTGPALLGFTSYMVYNYIMYNYIII